MMRRANAQHSPTLFVIRKNETLNSLRYILILFLLVLTSTVTLLAQTPAGTQIDNIGTAQFQFLNGQGDSTSSNVATIVVEGSGLLSLSKTASSATALPGDTIMFTLIASNPGNKTVFGVNVVDTLASSLLFISASKGTVNGNVIIWHLDSLTMGMSDTLIIMSQVRADAPYNTTITNIVIGQDTTGVPTSDTVTVRIPPSGLSLSKTASEDTVLTEDSLSYTIVLRNTGEIVLTNVALFDTVPSQLTNISVSPNAQLTNGVVAYSRSTFTVSERDSILIRATVLPYRPDGELIINTAFALSDQTPQQSAAAQSVIRFIEAPSLQLTKHVSKDTVFVGDTLRYVINIENTGNIYLPSVTVRDTIPVQLENVTVSQNAQLLNGVITYTKDTLDRNQKDSITILATVKTDRANGEIIRNIAYAQSSKTTEQNSEVTTIIKVVESPALLLTKDVSSDTVLALDSVQYTIQLRNIGNSPLTNVSLTDTIPPQLGNVQVSPNAQLNNGIATMTIDSFAIGQSEVVTVTATAPNGPNGEFILNTAYAQSNKTAEQSARAAFTVKFVEVPSLAFTKTVSKDTAFAGDTLTYVLNLQNTGNISLPSVAVIDTLPQDLNFVSVSPNAQFNNGVITYSKDTLGISHSDSIRITVTVAIPQFQNMTVINTAYGQSSRTAQQQSSASTVIRFIERPSLILTKGASQDSAFANDTLRYTISLYNNGNITLTNLSVRDTLPSQLTFISVSPNAQFSNGVALYLNDSLIVGGQDSIIIVASVKTGRPQGEIVLNTVVAQSAQTSPQSAHAQTIIKVLGSPALAFTKSVSRDTVLAGDTLRYNIQLRNTGNISLTNVEVTDTIPAQLNVLSISPNAQVTNGVVRYSNNSMPVNQIDSLWILAQVKANSPNGEIITNVAYAQSSELVPQQSSAISIVRVLFTPALSLTKVVSKDTALVGDTLYYYIHLQNIGNSVLSNVSLNDTLPQQLIPISVSSNAQLTNGIVTYSRNSFALNETDSIVVASSIPSNRPNREVILNTAYARSNETPFVTAQAQTITRVIVPDLSCQMILTATPDLVIGNGRTPAVLIAYVSDTLGNPKPDGTPVHFTTTFGTYSNGLDSITISTVNGFAIDSMKVLTANGIVTALAVATASDDEVCRASDSVEVIFFPGAIRGVVTDKITQLPVEEAIVKVFASNGDSVGGQVTKADGRYLIPVPRTDIYTVVIIIVNEFGQTVEIRTLVEINVPGEGIPPIPNKNSISGTVYYIVSNRPVLAPNIPVVLNLLASKGAKTSAVPVDSTITDSTGTYKFEDIQAGTYEVYISHPKIGGRTNAQNLGDGEYVINANIPVILNPNVSLAKTGPSRAAVDDTVTYTITYGNSGNLPLTNVSLIDTLDQLMRFVSASDGGMYDPAGHRILWSLVQLDSTQPLNYTVQVRFSDSLNVNSTLTNRVTLTSDQTTPIPAQASTLIIVPSSMRIWKLSDVSNAAEGDTVTYTIFVENNAGTLADSIVVTDNLPSEVEYLGSVPSVNYDPLLHSITWNVDTLSVGRRDTLKVITRVRNGLAAGEHRYTNIARLTWPFGDLSSDGDSASKADVYTLVSYLKISKEAVRKIVEVGDIVTYVVRVTNASPADIARSIEIVDRIPFGFRYADGSSFRDTIKIADPSGTKELRWRVADSLAPNASVQLIYRLIAGAGAIEGDGINTAQALALSSNGTPMSSPLASARVEVRKGVFTERGLVIGKVFYDDNRNAHQDEGEGGVKGIELMAEDGTRVITGDDGKYSLPDIAPGEHVIRVREHTLPAGSELLLGYNDFANVASSRFVRVPESGIARADFYLSRSLPVILDQKISKVGTVEVQRISSPKNAVFIEDERLAPLKLAGTNFEVAKAILRPEAFPTLKTVAQIMREYDEEKLIISGHTDSMRIHTKEFPSNKELSEARARAAKEYLVRVEGIDENRIETFGYGPERPVATNKTKEGRLLNRRVEFDFSGTRDKKEGTTTAIVFNIPIRYDGAVPVKRLELNDVLDTAFHYDAGSATLNGSVITPRIDGQNLYWTIDNIGTQYQATLTYRAIVNKPQVQLMTISSSTEVRYVINDTTSVNSDTATTTNNIAVAVRGKAINFIFSGVLFDVAKATLRKGAYTAVQEAGSILKASANSTALIEGHTDARPIHTAEFPSNIELSQARAQTIVDLLSIDYGIEQQRLRAIGWGEMRPISDNATAEGRQANRRVEIRVYLKDFIDQVIQEGFVDSSKVLKQIFTPDDKQFDSLSSGNPGERFLLKLDVQKQKMNGTTSMTIIDTLIKNAVLVDGSLTKVQGIDSTWTDENILYAKCSLKDESSTLLYMIELAPDANKETLLRHTYCVNRKLSDGSTMIEESKPVIISIRKK
jgi:uncharacterized repeat protein (TIGR01451 family)